MLKAKTEFVVHGMCVGMQEYITASLLTGVTSTVTVKKVPTGAAVPRSTQAEYTYRMRVVIEREFSQKTIYCGLRYVRLGSYLTLNTLRKASCRWVEIMNQVGTRLCR